MLLKAKTFLNVISPLYLPSVPHINVTFSSDIIPNFVHKEFDENSRNQSKYSLGFD